MTDEPKIGKADPDRISDLFGKLTQADKDEMKWTLREQLTQSPISPQVEPEKSEVN